ncbi:putative mitochondrial rRNA methyltransferase [Candida maltosa Xu316]|uniref:rRNA methyltransferase 2, mitochondrial n=1 Tax=Candida maltosa (strain Xu316) TaxID=1245528 RepID=M3JAR9_CANMX|nr:putative mitochondrial rRNA methyltransferase [Candida maltosa Xu316]
MNRFLASRLTFVRFKSKPTKDSKKYVHGVLDDTFAVKKRLNMYKSRAAFKLEEIDQKFHIFSKDTRHIVDLGYAPGAWSQYAVKRLNELGLKSVSERDKTIKKDKQFLILGVDLNTQATPVKGCYYLTGNVMSQTTHLRVKDFFRRRGHFGGPIYDEDKELDLVMSDMMVDCVGNSEADHLGNMELCEAALYLAYEQLKPNRDIVLKVWSGSELSKFENKMKILFKNVYAFKPKASKDKSSELYFIGKKKFDIYEKGISIKDVFGS